MIYTAEEIMEFVEQEDVKFIRMAFCDVFGVQKNVSIMPTELTRAFESGISIDASAVRGFGDIEKSDLFLFPDASTLTVLPWRPSHGKVVRLFCSIKYPDGTPFELDGRYILRQAIKKAREEGIICRFGAEFEFYLFKTDDDGEPTLIPHDNASYMDIAPDDKGENVRREICLTLEEMGFCPESSHHEEGPGQHEVDFKYSDPMTAADNAIAFKAAVQTIASRNGLYASFAPKPLKGQSGNGLHINMSLSSADGKDYTMSFMAGIMKHIRDITAFLNTVPQSYERLGEKKAPKYVSWSKENRSQLIRIPAAEGEYKRIELRSPDPETNPYLAYALLIFAGLNGIKNQLQPCEPADINLFSASSDVTDGFERLPKSLEEALDIAADSEFVRSSLPARLIDVYKGL